VSQVTAVHPLASGDVHEVHVPSTTAAHDTSQPVVASLSALPLPAIQLTAVHPLVSAEVQAVQVPSVTLIAAQQLKSSLFEVVANWFDGQVEHAFASTNGSNSGFDM